MSSTPIRSLLAAAALTVPSPAFPQQSGSFVAVALSAVDSVAILDAGSLAPIATLGVGNDPHEIAASPDGTRAYVANAGDSTISVIDVSAAPRVVATWRLPRAIGVHDLAATADGRVIAVSGRKQVALELDAASGAVLRIDTIPSAGPWMIDAAGRGGPAVIASMDGGSVTLLRDGERREFPGAAGEIDAAMSPNGAQVWSVNFQTGDLTVFDARDGAVLQRAPSGRMTTRIVFVPGGRTALTVNGGDSTIVAWEVSTRRRTATIRLPRSPKVIALGRDGRRAYVSHPGGAVSALDLETMTVVRTVPLDGRPDGVAVLHRTPRRDVDRGSSRAPGAVPR